MDLTREEHPTGKKRKNSNSKQESPTKRSKKESGEDQLEESTDEICSDPSVEWICSHILPKMILWSSDESKLKPNVDLSYLNVTEHGENNVVNTWFVEDPVPSNPGGHDPIWQKELLQAANLIKESTAILVIAGAGIGVDSGLPDYRGPQGFWRAYPKLVTKGMSLEEMSHPDWFNQDPISAWGFYGHRASLYTNANPHKGFQILKEIVKMKQDNYFIFTSNIDNQFQTAGFNEDKIFEAHGSLIQLQCVNEECDEVWGSDGTIPKSNKEFQAIGQLPICPKCGSAGRPNVSMFGDTNITWKDTRASMQKLNFMKWLRRVLGSIEDPNRASSVRRSSRRCGNQKLAILEIGCGVSLHSLRLEAELLISMKTDSPVNCIRINPTNYQIKGSGNVGLGLGAMESLQEISKLLGIKEVAQ